MAQRVSTQVTAFFAELENELRVVGKVQGLPRLDRDKHHSVLSELLLYQHVAAVFTSMTTQLRGLITGLEQRVTERTASLQTPNAQLQHEITECQRTEMALQQAKDAAEMASHAKADFLATMSHENPHAYEQGHWHDRAALRHTTDSRTE